MKEALLNWNARRDKITRAYVAFGDFATIVKRRDRCLILLLSIEVKEESGTGTRLRGARMKEINESESYPVNKRDVANILIRVAIHRITVP